MVQKLQITFIIICDISYIVCYAYDIIFCNETHYSTVRNITNRTVEIQTVHPPPSVVMSQ